MNKSAPQKWLFPSVLWCLLVTMVLFPIIHSSCSCCIVGFCDSNPSGVSLVPYHSRNRFRLLFTLWGGGGGTNFVLALCSLYPGQQLEVYFILLYYQCVYLTSQCVWHTSITIYLHTLAIGHRFPAGQTRDTTRKDASHTG